MYQVGGNKGIAITKFTRFVKYLARSVGSLHSGHFCFVPSYEPRGSGFESCQPRQPNQRVSSHKGLTRLSFLGSGVHPGVHRWWDRGGRCGMALDGSCVASASTSVSGDTFNGRLPAEDWGRSFSSRRPMSAAAGSGRSTSAAACDRSAQKAAFDLVCPVRAGAFAQVLGYVSSL